MIRIILIVGASGAGKDTLLRTIKEQIDVNFVERHITRIPDGNEENYYLSPEDFAKLESESYFISTWSAHGNRYGIAKNRVKDGVNIISVSRGVIADFENAYDDVHTIEITVPREKLEARLLIRGREDAESIRTRLDREYKQIDAKKLIQFDNSKSLENSSIDFLNLLHNIKDNIYK